MAEEDLDLVFHLGDDIYEYGGQDGRVRRHPGEEIEVLADYRNRYAWYRTDPDLQAAHAMFPWVVTWDDHEVDNNYAADVSEERGLAAELFLRRRAEAYQAYYEHMPVRRASWPAGASMQLYRRFTYGDLASFFVLDTRQYRSDQPCGDRLRPVCPGVMDPDATLLGIAQKAWLQEGLDSSTTRWNVIPQQVMMARLDRGRGEEEEIGMDTWSGYETERRNLLEFLARRQPENPIVLTGDIHSNWVNDLQVDYQDPVLPPIGAEFVGTSISSGGDGSDDGNGSDMLARNPAIRFFNNRRGYVSCDATHGQWKAHYRVLDFVTRPDSPLSTRASFIVADGHPGAESA